MICAHYIKTCLSNLFSYGSLRYSNVKRKHFIICGEEEETNRVKGLLHETYPNIGQIKTIDIKINLSNEINRSIYEDSRTIFNELIFCAKNITPSEIIRCMNQLAGQEIHFKIAQPDTSFIIGSNSIETRGDLYAMKINSISRPDNLRSKRIFDLFVSFIGLCISPLTIWFFEHKKQFLLNLFSVFKGEISIVGYCTQKTEGLEN